MKLSTAQNIRIEVKKIFLSRLAVISVFIILQLIFKLLHLNNPSDDFKTYFWNNANNIQHIGYEFESLGGEKYIADGNIERFGYTPPAYTYLVAAIIKMGGGLGTLFYINVLLLCFTIAIAKKIFELVTDNSTIIYLSLWILVLNPLFVNIPRLYLSEGLFSFLTISSIYFYIVSLKNKNGFAFIIAVFLMMLSIETRAINLYLLPVLLLPFLFTKQIIWQKILYITVSIAALFISINLHSSNNSSYLRRSFADGLSRFEGNEVADKLHHSVGPKQDNWQSSFKSEIATQFTEHPVDFGKLYITKFVKSWYTTDSGNNEAIIWVFQMVHLLAFIILLILFLIRKIWDPHLFILLLVVLYTNLVVTATLSICRYMSPIVPLYVFCTVYLGGMIYKKYIRRKS